ncbi:hypothetical protein GCM10023237_70410 [Streptomyces coeruleoprunus]
MARVGVRGGADDADAEHGQRASGDPFDDADTAPRQAWVHPENAHAPLLRSAVQLFVQASRCH